MRDLRSNVDAAVSLAPAARNASANGAAVDLQGYDAAMALAHFGTWTDGSHTPSLEESDDGTSFTAIASNDLQGAFAAVTSAAGNSSIQRVGYLGRKRYVRAVMTVSGATTGAVAAIAIVRGVPHRAAV